MAKRIILHDWDRIVKEAHAKYHNPKSKEKHTYTQYVCKRCGKVTVRAYDILSSCEEHEVENSLYINK